MVWRERRQIDFLFLKGVRNRSYFAHEYIEKKCDSDNNSIHNFQFVSEELHWTKRKHFDRYFNHEHGKDSDTDVMNHMFDLLDHAFTRRCYCCCGRHIGFVRQWNAGEQNFIKFYKQFTIFLLYRVFDLPLHTDVK